MSKTIGKLADELLETIWMEDEQFFQRHGFYTMRTKAGDCIVRNFDWPKEQKQLEEFDLWRNTQ